MAKGSDNEFPSVLVLEGTAPANPAAGDQRLFIDSTSHHLKRVNSGGSVVDIEAGAAALVNARANTDSGSISAGTDQTIDFGTVDYDTDSAITTGASWVYTVPSTGKYRVSATVLLNGTFSAGTYQTLLLKINGSTYCDLVYTEAYSGSFYAPLHGDTTVSLTAGDTISIAVHNDQGGTLTLGASAVFNFVTIEKL